MSCAVIAAFAFAWFGAQGGWDTLDPTNISWMLEGDWLGHLLGWFFVRNGPFGLPMTLAPDLIYPYGSSAAFTDAIPIASFVTKLFSPLLPVSFQFFGWWIFKGFVVHGWVGFFTARLFTKDWVTVTLVGCLFVLNPMLIGRYGHPPFYAMWTVFLLVALGFAPVSDTPHARRLLLVGAAVAAFAGGVNTYLAVMAFALVLALIARFALAERRITWREALVWLALGPGGVLLSMAFFGFFHGLGGGPPMRLGVEGFGQFSSDLLTFINPADWSRIVPKLPMGYRQGEGGAYLGLGVLLLLVFRLIPGKHKVKVFSVGAVPTLLVASAMAFYALSSIVTVGGKMVLSLEWLYAPFSTLTSMFRSSGRFVWALHALVTLLAVSGVSRFAARAWLGRVVLLLACALQCYELKTSLSGFNGEYAQFKPLPSPTWSLMGEYKHLFVHPVQVQWICPYDHELIAHLSWEAYRQHLTINSGHVGRVPDLIADNCMRHLPPNELDAQTVYVVHFPQFLGDFTQAGYHCGAVEERVLCVSPDRETKLKAALDADPVTRPPPGWPGGALNGKR